MKSLSRRVSETLAIRWSKRLVHLVQAAALVRHFAETVAINTA